MNPYSPSGTAPMMPPPVPPQMPRPKKRHPIRTAMLGIGSIVFVAVVAISVLGSGTVTFPPAQPKSVAPPVPSGPVYTVPQQQAIASAKDYLQTEPGWSKLGLAGQLRYEKFSSKLALFAVNHVHANWMQQAVYSAQSYMKSEPGWSFSGLVGQLEYEKYTPAQAAHGAHAVGL
jgi:hypothetical protein